MVESIRMPYKGQKPYFLFDRKQKNPSSLSPENVLGKVKINDIGETKAGYFYILKSSNNPNSEKVYWNGEPGYREYVEEDIKKQD